MEVSVSPIGNEEGARVHAREEGGDIGGVPWSPEEGLRQPVPGAAEHGHGPQGLAQGAPPADAEMQDKEAEDLFDEPEEEQRMPKHHASPTDPTIREVEEHLLTGHAAYRSWCAACVRGRGRAAGHPVKRDDQAESQTVPVLSWDYCFLSARTREEDRNPERSGESPVIVMHDSKSKGVYAAEEGCGPPWLRGGDQEGSGGP